MKLFGFAEDDKNGAGFEMKSKVVCYLSHEDARVFQDFASVCAKEMKSLCAEKDRVGFAAGEIPDVTIDRWFAARKQ